jgi:hypothetical protein
MKARIPTLFSPPKMGMPRVPHVPMAPSRPKLPKPMEMMDEPMAGPSLLEKHLMKRAMK